MAYSHPVLTSHARSKVQFVEWLQSEHLLAAEPSCPYGSVTMATQRCALFNLDGVCFRCPKCHRRRSVRGGSRFEQSANTSLELQTHFMVNFDTHSSAVSTAKQWNVNRHTVERHFNRYRAMVDTEVTRMVGAREIEFTGAAVEVDVMHVQDVRDIEHDIRIPDLCIFGLYEHSSRIMYAKIIPDEKTATLEAAILEWVPLASIVYTDAHAAFRRLLDLGYEHYSVNHTAGEYARQDSDVFGDEITVTTNHVESLWSQLRPRVEPHYARNLDRISSEVKRLVYETNGYHIFDLFRC